MKKCAKCDHVYFDETLNFCLADGEPLKHDARSAPTVVMSPRTINSTSGTASKAGVSPLFAYLSIGLIALLIGGGIVAVVLWGILPGKAEAPLAKNLSNAALSNAASVAKVDASPQVIYEPAPAPIRVPVPLSQSKTKGLKLYTGTIGDSPASFDLVWNRDSTISGNFFYTSEPNKVYSISGSNYVEGTSELRVSDGNAFIGQMQLKKYLEGNMLCWQGSFSAQGRNVRFCRRR